MLDIVHRVFFWAWQFPWGPYLCDCDADVAACCLYAQCALLPQALLWQRQDILHLIVLWGWHNTLASVGNVEVVCFGQSVSGCACTVCMQSSKTVFGGINTRLEIRLCRALCPHNQKVWLSKGIDAVEGLKQKWSALHLVKMNILQHFAVLSRFTSWRCCICFWKSASNTIVSLINDSKVRVICTYWYSKCTAETGLKTCSHKFREMQVLNYSTTSSLQDFCGTGIRVNISSFQVSSQDSPSLHIHLYQFKPKHSWLLNLLTFVMGQSLSVACPLKP